MLPVDEMRRRLDAILAGSARFLAQMPDSALAQMLPKRPRSFAQLGWHIANIADAFLEHENGTPLTFDSYMRVPEEQDATREKLIAYCEEMRQRMSDWFDGPGRTRDWSARADVYYGGLACGPAFAAIHVGAGRLGHQPGSAFGRRGFRRPAHAGECLG
jgi:hypothetical protein